LEKTKKCFNCGRYGHMSLHCPEPVRQGGVCYLCHLTGHVKKACPKIISQVGNQESCSSEVHRREFRRRDDDDDRDQRARCRIFRERGQSP